MIAVLARQTSERNHKKKTAWHAKLGDRVSVRFWKEHWTRRIKPESTAIERMLSPLRRGACSVVSADSGARRTVIRSAVRSIARRIGGAEDRHAWLVQRRRQVERPAVDTDHG